MASAVEDLELKLSKVRGYVRFLHGKRVVVKPYTNSVVAEMKDAPVIRVRAESLKTGDVFHHPVDSTVHHVRSVSPDGSHVVIRSQPYVLPHDDDRRMAALIDRPVAEHRTDKRSMIKRIVGAAALSLIGVGALAGCARSGGHDPVINHSGAGGPAPIVQTVTPTTHAPTTHASASVAQRVVPAPQTATGYKVAFSRLDHTQWGAADVGATVPLGTVSGQPRTVWLFGDTMSQRPGGFVHSTAILQTGGTLHVSNQGRQLLPNDDARHVYWIEGGKAIGPNAIHITARSIHITDPNNPWGFADNGFTRTALATVDKSGNVNFVRWLNKKISPPPDPGPMYTFGDHNPHHFGYSRKVHPELKLAGGKMLVSTAQNWDDPLQNHVDKNGQVRWADFQLVFTAARAVPK